MKKKEKKGEGEEKGKKTAATAPMASPVFHPNPNHLLPEDIHHPEFHGHYV